MGRYIWSVVVFGFVSAIAFGQDGYREYRWGYSVEQITEIEGPLEESWSFGGFPTPQMALLFLYADEFEGNAPNPLTYEERGISARTPEGTDGGWGTPPLTFWLAENELVAVALSQFETPVLSALRSRYGTAQLISGVMGGGYQFEVAVWSDGDRLVVWDAPSGRRDMETVTYMSRDWFDSLISRLRKERTAAQKNSTDRLD